MAQKTVYACDTCDKLIGNKPHFSLAFNQYSGIALPPHTPFKDGSANTTWTLAGGIKNKFVHFCSTKCLTAYFETLLVKLSETLK